MIQELVAGVLDRLLNAEADAWYDHVYWTRVDQNDNVESAI